MQGSGTRQVIYTAVLPFGQPPAQDPNNPNPPAPNPPAAQPPEHERKLKYEFYVGPDLGVYMPTSAKTTGRFGNDWFSYGVGITPLSTPRSRGRFSPDIQILSQSSGDDSLFFGLIGIEYRQALLPHLGGKPPKQKQGQPPPPPIREPELVPYVGVSAYDAVGDLKAVEDNVHSGIRSGAAGAAFVGVEYRNRAYLEARYIQTSVLKGFDLSGFSISIGYRFRIAGY
jgi:hypothetical protein